MIVSVYECEYEESDTVHRQIRETETNKKEPRGRESEKHLCSNHNNTALCTGSSMSSSFRITFNFWMRSDILWIGRWNNQPAHPSSVRKKAFTIRVIKTATNRQTNQIEYDWKSQPQLVSHSASQSIMVLLFQIPASHMNMKCQEQYIKPRMELLRLKVYR